MTEKKSYAKCPKCGMVFDKGSFGYRVSICIYDNEYLEYFTEE